MDELYIKEWALLISEKTREITNRGINFQDYKNYKEIVELSSKAILSFQQQFPQFFWQEKNKTNES